MSACMAVRLATVSSSVSPLVWEEVAILRLTTSADSRLAAISKVVRVRVLGSKNRLKIALPRSSGTFLTSRSVTETKERAVSRICSRISGGRPSMVSRCLQLAARVQLRVARSCASASRRRQRQRLSRPRRRAAARSSGRARPRLLPRRTAGRSAAGGRRGRPARPAGCDVGRP